MIKLIKYSNPENELFDCFVELLESEDGGVMLRVYAKGDYFAVEKYGDNYFSVLQEIRKVLVEDGIELLCNGTSVNVYPSAMQLGMGGGDRAYYLRMGIHTSMDDIVEVFDYDPTNHIRGSIDQQIEYHKRWVISKKKRVINQPKYTIDKIDPAKGKYLFFWGHQKREDGQLGKSCLSQWWPCEFEKEGVIYSSAEQWMMAEKARIFGDLEILKKILDTASPKEAKTLGRKVSFFEQATWDLRCFDIVKQGNLLKFSQNRDLKSFLVNTMDAILVEASPYDKIWGIGMREGERGIENPSNWKGENLLGFALMEVRDIILKENKL